MINDECACCVGYVCLLVLLGAVNMISAFTECYPLNGQRYCFYTNGSVMSWDKAREFCGRTNSTLPIITDENIDNVFHQFMSDSNITEVTAADTEPTNVSDYVWLGAHASPVNNSVPWHWINGQPSGCTHMNFLI